QSDHTAIDSRYLLHEAQQAYYHGLPRNTAIASVTSNTAEAMGDDFLNNFMISATHCYTIPGM
ncbi:hypothetical protein EV359DRAFT_42977, partial [Lentinula novae-zelandiae]